MAEIKTIKKINKSSDDRYIETVGRRKTAIARIRITPASKMSFEVNDKELHVYFSIKEMQVVVKQPFASLSAEEKFLVTVKLVGGGLHSQAEAMRHGVARALVEYRADLRKDLKKAGFLKRDPRAKERRKFGLKKARKAPQWSKR